MIVFFDQSEHGTGVPTLGSHGKPMLCISHAPEPLSDLGNSRWICPNIATRHLNVDCV